MVKLKLSTALTEGRSREEEDGKNVEQSMHGGVGLNGCCNGVLACSAEYVVAGFREELCGKWLER